ncbi:hypothetical protein LCGC14_1103330 [marine sediment metagenome]|uniref:Uncharacterized protein n=1 Tax=marine sediment metagenome TaxID=412755 RepID=A0A0F9QF37_9ZZZZ
MRFYSCAWRYVLGTALWVFPLYILAVNIFINEVPYHQGIYAVGSFGWFLALVVGVLYCRKFYRSANRIRSHG